MVIVGLAGAHIYNLMMLGLFMTGKVTILTHIAALFLYGAGLIVMIIEAPSQLVFAQVFALETLLYGILVMIGIAEMLIHLGILSQKITGAKNSLMEAQNASKK